MTSSSRIAVTAEAHGPRVIVDVVDPRDFSKLITYEFPNSVSEHDEHDNLTVRSVNGWFTATWSVEAWAGCSSSAGCRCDECSPPVRR